MTQLPQLYKKTRTGAIQTCIISYQNNEFTVEFGQLDGKMQTQTTECFTTNKGRANQRLPEAQAEFEAKAKWDKKVKSGYSTNIEAPITVLLPQKVKGYQDQLHNVHDEVYVSDKLDGVNGIYRITNGLLTLYSRGGEIYPEIPHLSGPIFNLMMHYDLDELNIELYIPNTFLQDIQSAVKKPKELSTRLEAHIFEVPTYQGSYTAHIDYMNSFEMDYYPMVYVIPSHFVPKSEIEGFFECAIANGAEGLIIRNPDGVYVHNQRSTSVFKYKKALDAEYLISHYELDKNSQPVFLCHTADGKPFKVKPKGTKAQRQAIVNNIDQYLDSYYKIEYETLSATGVPLKPVGIALRNCDADGNPLE